MLYGSDPPYSRSSHRARNTGSRISGTRHAAALHPRKAFLSGRRQFEIHFALVLLSEYALDEPLLLDRTDYLRRVRRAHRIDCRNFRQAERLPPESEQSSIASFMQTRMHFLEVGFEGLDRSVNVAHQAYSFHNKLFLYSTNVAKV